MKMEATGIVRRIDDLGRLCIPKEIRRGIHLQENDPVEIFSMSDGGVYLRKYTPNEGDGPTIANTSNARDNDTTLVKFRDAYGEAILVRLSKHGMAVLNWLESHNIDANECYEIISNDEIPIL